MSTDYLDQMIADGFGRATLVGALSTGLVGGGAGTVILVARPLLAIAVPARVVLRPIYFGLAVQPGIETADDDELGIPRLRQLPMKARLASRFGSSNPSITTCT